MSLLRFRFKFDDYDDVHRDIDIKSDQTFAELLQCALQSVGFDQRHEANFYLADHNWRKNGHIGKVSPEEKGALHKMEIVEQIDDPHQKFLLEYDPEKPWQFTLELIKIMPVQDKKALYPLVATSVGLPPVQYLETIVIPVRERTRKTSSKEEDDDALFEEDFLENELTNDAVEDTDIVDASVDGAVVETIADLPENFEVEADDEIEKLKNEMSGNFIETSDQEDEDSDFGGYGEEDDEYGMGGDDDDYGGGYGSRNDYDE
ncbi:MAG: IS1096 element passenger TnpR family protein [Flavobacteriales bacterium]